MSPTGASMAAIFAASCRPTCMARMTISTWPPVMFCRPCCASFTRRQSPAKRRVPVWGSGRPRREFLHVDDMAAASVHLLELAPETYWSVASERCSHVNVGTGTDISIAELAELIATVSGFERRYRVRCIDAGRDAAQTSRRRADRASLAGKRKSVSRTGIRQTYEWMTAHWQEIAAG